MIIKIYVRNYDSGTHPLTTCVNTRSQSPRIHCTLKQNSHWTPVTFRLNHRRVLLKNQRRTRRRDYIPEFSLLKIPCKMCLSIGTAVCLFLHYGRLREGTCTYMLRALRAQRVEIKKSMCLHSPAEPSVHALVAAAAPGQLGAPSSSGVVHSSRPPPPRGEGAWVNGSKVLEKLG